MKHVSLQICEWSQERKEQIVVFALLEAEPWWHWECHEEAAGMLLREVGRIQKGLILPAWRGGWNINLSRFLLDLFYYLYDVIIIFNTSDLIFLATPFQKAYPLSWLCTLHKCSSN